MHLICRILDEQRAVAQSWVARELDVPLSKAQCLLRDFVGRHGGSVLVWYAVTGVEKNATAHRMAIVASEDVAGGQQCKHCKLIVCRILQRAPLTLADIEAQLARVVSKSVYAVAPSPAPRADSSGARDPLAAAINSVASQVRPSVAWERRVRGRAGAADTCHPPCLLVPLQVSALTVDAGAAGVRFRANAHSQVGRVREGTLVVWASETSRSFFPIPMRRRRSGQMPSQCQRDA